MYQSLKEKVLREFVEHMTESDDFSSAAVERIKKGIAEDELTDPDKILSIVQELESGNED